MCYVSHAIARVKLNYPFTEKFTCTLIFASRKLNPHFEAHKIIVLTDQPLKGILQKLGALGHVLKWVIELS